MSKPLFFALFIFSHFYGCTNKNEKEISVKNMSKINITEEVNKEVIIFQKKLNKEYLTSEEVIFAIDTFRLNCKNRKNQDFDSSTEAMNNSVLEMRDGYQMLLERYYQKMLQKLDEKDKPIFAESQKEWLRFKEKDEMFIELMENEKYNSGGSIQSHIAIGNSFDLIKIRVEEIFSYYNSIVEKEEN
ncbi:MULTISPECIES: lysozyme inhibitor LprI family protein [Flavobacterium]|uniref:Lysozyme inhibitor LprI-like N-terminal domain-containing protein n=1 Tax=Flavobacterium hankyongi TaxID=1176532 RepID=A0ABP8ZQM7_9FLAO|nr:lysozyme inhibitor LprI family protein [Flavobacterium sp. N1846]